MSSGQHQPSVSMGQQPDYSTWSTSSLIEKISELERQLKSRTAEYTILSPHWTSKTETIEPARPSSAAGQTTDSSEHQVIEKKGRKFCDEDITHSPANRPPKQPKVMDPSKYSTRYIALKFAYLGQRYNGLEHANGNVTPLPTIEEELWKALRRTRLIFPTDMPIDYQDRRESKELKPREMKPFELSWEGCEYSKAGRTDRGVSAFGQVIGIKVRSARPKHNMVQTADHDLDTTMENTGEVSIRTQDTTVDRNWDDIADEIPYISLLNKALPEDIRVLAWCPHPPEGFNARFSCRERQYKYFFTQPAFAPTPGPLGFASRGGGGTPKYREGWLDIEAMQEAARSFKGVHDFRNFCKVDTSKQIENFERIIYHADIELLDPKKSPLGFVNNPGFQALDQSAVEIPGRESYQKHNSPQVYVFTLHGSAFLWHQVRHMVGILFLVGQGLESPSIVPELLDVSRNPRKPMYEMASDAPLVLWDCIFPDENSGNREDALEWIYAGDSRQIKSQFSKGGGKFGIGGVVEDLWSVWRQRKMDEVLASTLLDLVMQQGDQEIVKAEIPTGNKAEKQQNRGQKVFSGANEAKVGGKYVPIMQKKKMEPVEVLNARWLSKQRKVGEGSPLTNMETLGRTL